MIELELKRSDIDPSMIELTSKATATRRDLWAVIHEDMLWHDDVLRQSLAAADDAGERLQVVLCLEKDISDA